MSFDQTGFYSDVALRMQLHRRKLDLTQAEVAASIGIPRATYANVERGRQRIPVDLLWRVAVLFGTPVTSLLPEPVTAHTRILSPEEPVITSTTHLGFLDSYAKTG